MIDYNKRLAEVDVILSLLSESDYNKIPNEIIQVIKENKDKNYIWEYDESKPLKDQNISRDTIIFLSYINMEYLMNEEQKAYMQKIHEINERKKIKNEYSNQQQNDYSDIFKTKTQKIEETYMTTYKVSFWAKMIDKIKQIFRI